MFIYICILLMMKVGGEGAKMLAFDESTRMSRRWMREQKISEWVNLIEIIKGLSGVTVLFDSHIQFKLRPLAVGVYSGRAIRLKHQHIFVLYIRLPAAPLL